MIQLLFNSACELPALLERYHDMADKEDTSNIADVEQLRNDYQTLMDTFQNWESTLCSKSTSPLCWFKHIPNDSVSSSGDILWFPDVMTATSLTHCWAFRIIAKDHLSKLGGVTRTAKGYGQAPTLELFSDSTSEQSIATLAEMICNSIPYLTQPDMKLTGPGSVFCTLPIAMQVFRKRPDDFTFQLSRCQQFSNRLASLGFHFSVDSVDPI
jgi:hypothetical protein